MTSVRKAVLPIGLAVAALGCAVSTLRPGHHVHPRKGQHPVVRLRRAPIANAWPL